MERKQNITGIILAGGKSSRMGTEKGLIRFRGKPFIQHVIDALEPLVSKLIIVSSNSEYDVFKYQRIEDIIRESGPLAGIHSGLTHSSTTYNLVLSCDVPNITTEALRLLLEHIAENADIVQFESEGQTMPLTALYAKDCNLYFEELLQKGERRLRYAVSQLKTKTVAIPKHMANQLININTKPQLKSLQHAVNH